MSRTNGDKNNLNPPMDHHHEYHAEIALSRSSSSPSDPLCPGILWAFLDDNNESSNNGGNNNNGSASKNTTGRFLHLRVMSASDPIQDQQTSSSTSIDLLRKDNDNAQILRGWSCALPCRGLREQWRHKPALQQWSVLETGGENHPNNNDDNSNEDAIVWQQFLAMVQNGDNDSNNSNSNHGKIRTEWKWNDTSSSSSSTLTLDAIYQKHAGMSVKLWNTTLTEQSNHHHSDNNDDNNHDNNNPCTIFTQHCLGGLYQRVRRQEAVARALQDQVTEARRAVAEWRQTAATLQTAWQAEKVPLLRKFVTLYQSKQKQITALQARVAELERQQQQSSKRRNPALAVADMASHEPDDMDHDIEHLNDIMTGTNKRKRTKEESGTQVYTSVDLVMSDPTLFGKNKPDRVKSRRREPKPQEKPPPPAAAATQKRTANNTSSSRTNNRRTATAAATAKPKAATRKKAPPKKKAPPQPPQDESETDDEPMVLDNDDNSSSNGANDKNSSNLKKENDLSGLLDDDDSETDEELMNFTTASRQKKPAAAATRVDSDDDSDDDFMAAFDRLQAAQQNKSPPAATKTATVASLKRNAQSRQRKKSPSPSQQDQIDNMMEEDGADIMAQLEAMQGGNDSD